MINHPSICLVTPVGATSIATRPLATGAGQDILVEATLQGGHLARFLAALDGEQEPERERIGDLDFYVVPHSPFLDARITELVGTLIELRIAHSRQVQVEIVVERSSTLSKAHRAEGLRVDQVEGRALSLAERPALSLAEGVAS